MKQRFLVFLLPLFAPLFCLSQTLFDSIANSTTSTSNQNEKISSVFTYCEKQMLFTPDTVFGLLRESEVFLDEHKLDDRWGELFYLKADYYLLLENFDSSFVYYEKALVALNPNAIEISISCLVHLSFVEVKRDNLENAQRYLNEANMKIHSTTNPIQLGLINQQQALLYMLDDDFLNASNLFQKAIDQYRLIDDTLRIGSVYSDISLMYSKIGNYPLAIDFIEKAGNIFMKSNTYVLLANSQLLKGQIYLSSAKFNEALISFKACEILWDSVGNNIKLTMVYSRIGKAYEKLMDFDQSLFFLKKALSLALMLDNTADKAEVYLYLGDLYSKKGDIGKSQQYYQMSLQFIEQKDLKLDLYEKLSKNYSELSDFKKAYKFQILYNSLNKNILSEKSEAKIHRIEEQLSFERENAESLNKALQTELSGFIEKERKFDFWYRSIIGVQFLIMAIIIIVVFRRYKRNKQGFTQLKNTIRNQRINLGQSKLDYDKLKKSSERIFTITSKNMWEPFWVLERLSNQLISEEYREKLTPEKINFENDQLIMARNLLENVLHWVKHQQGLLEYSPKLHKVNKLLKPIIKIQALRAAAKNIEIKYNSQSDLDFYVDKTTIEIAIRNIIENAIKFSTLNGVISINVHSNNNAIEIKISDTGVGMTKDQISALFLTRRPYMASGTHGEKGVGLGLSLTKEFIENNNGLLKIESSIAQGTSVSIVLPTLS